MAQPPSQLQGGTKEPITAQPDPKCLHSTLKEFFNPLRAGDPGADFFAVYRKESSDFDRDYAGRYDGDLNTTLIFAGLFSAVSATFAAGVQPNLEQDPNDEIIVYMKILIHASNNTLFSDVGPSSATWEGPPQKFVIVQSLLYASLATSLFAAFLAMLGKQWVNRYLRNRGGSAADKSRDRQRKLDGFEEWYFYIAIESLPVMLQFAVLLFGCALSVYLWTISRAVAGIILGFTVAGIIVFVFFTVAAIPYYNCPYQTPLSIFVRAIIKCLARGGSTSAHSVPPYTKPPPRTYSRSEKSLGQRLRSGVRSALQNLGCVPNPPRGAGSYIPLAVAGPPINFGSISVDWEACEADARCISWTLDFTTDSDVTFHAARFAAHTTWYPEIAGTFSPRVLAKLFVDCLSGGRVAPGRSEHASVIGMALASIISIQLCMKPEKEDLQSLSESIRYHVDHISESEPTSMPGVGVLRIVLAAPDHACLREWDIFSSIPDDLPTTQKLCLSRIILQTIWRWRQIQGPPTIFNLKAIDLFCRALMANGDDSHPALKINCLLIMAISLGHQIGSIHTLFIPNNDGALQIAIDLFRQRLLASIEGSADQRTLTLVLSSLIHLDPVQIMGTGATGFLWITGILDSGYPEDERYRMAGCVVRLLGKRLDSGDPEPIPVAGPVWAAPLVRFLSLCERFHTTDSPPHPGHIALRILSTSPGPGHFDATILPILTWTLPSTHPLQSRGLALKIFHIFGSGWFSPQMETVSDENRDKLLRAVSNPFQYPTGTADYEPMMAAVVLIQFASSERWQKHLRDSNFTSCEDIASKEEGRTTLRGMLDTVADEWLELPRTPAKITTAIKRLRELQCLNMVEVVITWAQAAGVGSPEDHKAWRSTRAGNQGT